MRWDKVANLYSAKVTHDSEGNPSEEKADEATVFANAMNMGLESWAAARNSGLHADASIQVRSAEYSGQNRCEVDGTEYEVERSYDTGEYTTLTLKRRLRNVVA